MDSIISTYNLTKRFGNVYSVKSLNLKVKEGDVYGFLGPNGAGKSTTFKMLLGLVKPTDGKVMILGKDFYKNRRYLLNNIGSLIESPSYYGHLTGIENLRIIQYLRNVPDKNISEVLKIVRLEKQKNKKVSKYSLGMKQRLGIAMALMSFPKLLILDEPTNGLDPAGIEEIRELIKSLPHKYGITVLISSHLLSEIEQIATSVGIINKGKILFQGSMEKLQEKSSTKILIKTNNNILAKKLIEERGITSIIDGQYISLKTISDGHVALLNRMLINSNIDVIRIEEHKKSLESIFLELTGKGQSI